MIALTPSDRTQPIGRGISFAPGVCPHSGAFAITDKSECDHCPITASIKGRTYQGLAGSLLDDLVGLTRRFTSKADEFVPSHARRVTTLTSHMAQVSISEEAKKHEQCPPWVKSRHVRCKTSCPLYPQ